MTEHVRTIDVPLIICNKDSEIKGQAVCMSAIMQAACPFYVSILIERPDLNTAAKRHAKKNDSFDEFSDRSLVKLRNAGSPPGDEALRYREAFMFPFRGLPNSDFPFSSRYVPVPINSDSSRVPIKHGGADSDLGTTMGITPVDARRAKRP